MTGQNKIIYTVIALIILTLIFWYGFIKLQENSKLTPEVPIDEPSNEAKITYINATADKIVPELPFPGAVTGKEFTAIGKARGTWYFEASFPVTLLDKDGNKLVETYATAQGEWMTTEFVPFTSQSISTTYTGPATLVLHKDNPSGLPEHDASISFPITIE